MCKLSYLGPAGTFTEQAARALVPGAALSPAHTIDAVFAAVESGDAALGVVPVENVIEGAVNATIDRLVFESSLFIKRRLSVPITHNLLAADADAPVAKILSHPQALAQCRKFIAANYPNAQTAETTSTAEAARLAASSAGCAAIASCAAAELYGLATLAANIQDADANATQFILLGKEDTSAPRPGCVTTLAFSAENKPGGLFSVLEVFAVFDVNLTKILSRPWKGKGGYVFFADAECEDPQDMEQALRMVRRKATFFKALGSYVAE